MGWRKISVESWDKLWCENPENKDSMPNCHHTSDIRSILKHNGYNISSKLLNQKMDILELGDFDPSHININGKRSSGYNSLFINPEILEKD